MFVGAEAYPHERWDEGSYEYWQARITIEILRLNRTELVRPRMECIADLGLLLRFKGQGVEPTLWEKILERRCEPSVRFSSCCRYFVDLYNRDLDAAFGLAANALCKLGRPEEAKLLGH